MFRIQHLVSKKLQIKSFKGSHHFLFENIIIELVGFVEILPFEFSNFILIAVKEFPECCTITICEISEEFVIMYAVAILSCFQWQQCHALVIVFIKQCS